MDRPQEITGLAEVDWDAEAEDPDLDEAAADVPTAYDPTHPDRPRRRRRYVRGGRSKGENRAAQKIEVRRVAAEPHMLPMLRAHAATPRPQVRGDCQPGGANEARPCPWYGCKWHLGLDVNPASGTIYVRALDDIPDTCALDIADKGGVTLEAVGEAMNLTRERVRQVEVKAAIKLRPDLLGAIPELGEGG